MNEFADLSNWNAPYRAAAGHDGGMAADRRTSLPHNSYLEDPSPRTSQFFTASSLDGAPIPRREWLVPDLVPAGTVTLLGGDGGTGKSLLALQLAHAVATDIRWLGRQPATGPALFISAEDDRDELHRRLVDIVRASGGQLLDLDRLTIRSLAGEDALLAMLDRQTGALSPTSLYAEIEARIADEKPVLVVLDTLADLFPGNENDRAQARHFVGILRGWAIRQGCAVVLLAHPSLSGLNSGNGTSGSTAWNNSVRSRLYLERVVQDGHEADPDARVLSTKKANYGRTGGGISMTWKDGFFATHEPEGGLDRMVSSAKAERVFMELLRTFTEQGRWVNSGGGQTYAPSVFADHPNAEGISKRRFRGTMESLLARGMIRVEEHGPPSKRRHFLRVAE